MEILVPLKNFSKVMLKHYKKEVKGVTKKTKLEILYSMVEEDLSFIEDTFGIGLYGDSWLSDDNVTSQFDIKLNIKSDGGYSTKVIAYCLEEKEMVLGDWIEYLYSVYKDAFELVGDHRTEKYLFRGLPFYLNAYGRNHTLKVWFEGGNWIARYIAVEGNERLEYLYSAQEESLYRCLDLLRKRIKDSEKIISEGMLLDSPALAPIIVSDVE